MKHRLIIYPHCYSALTSQKLFVFAPSSGRSACIGREKMQDVAVGMDSMSFLYPDNNLTFSDFASNCEVSGLGAIHEDAPVPHIVWGNRCKSASSVEKLRRALDYCDGLNVLGYIKKLNVHTTNENQWQPPEHQDGPRLLDFPGPGRSCEENSGKYKALASYSLPNLTKVSLSGEVSEEMTRFFCEAFPQAMIEIRTMCRPGFNYGRLAALCDKSERIIARIFHPTDSVPQETAKERHPRIETVRFYLPHGKALPDAMLIDEPDILGFNLGTTADEIRRREYCNPAVFGSLSVSADGRLMFDGQGIADLSGDWAGQFAKWLYEEGNPWYLSRSRWPACSDCEYHALCPPLSVYERLGYAPRACKRKPE